MFKFLSYARRMNFKDKPNYNYLRGLLLNGLNIQGFYDDEQFDWTNLANPKLDISGEAKPKQLQVQTMLPSSIESSGTTISSNTKSKLASAVIPIITQLVAHIPIQQ